MNQLLLAPTDVLFFRDGRPMGGSSTGHGAAWPLPTVVNAALHAALWRSGLAEQAHAHGRDRPDGIRSERFGSLLSAGPFPVRVNTGAAAWFFPRPLDASCSARGTAAGSTREVRTIGQPIPALEGSKSSGPLRWAVASTVPASKEPVASWWSEAAWSAYLGREEGIARSLGFGDAIDDGEFSDPEATVGIAIDPATGTTGQGTAAGKIYSAHYLRLREGWNLGLLASTSEKLANEGLHGHREDLIPQLVKSDRSLLVGGQQRVCTAVCQPIAPGQALPLPRGRSNAADFSAAATGELAGKHLIKWALLTPAIFPQIDNGKARDGQPILTHPGGWLPSWIHPVDHAVQLRAPVEPRDVGAESREDYRSRIQKRPFVAARLVAALTGKPVPITGWSLGAAATAEAEGRTAGAKSTHLAVPAGSVYYFACETAAAAAELASVLNWHGETPGTELRHRRSTLLGEKGFGLGVCAPWAPPA